MEEWKKLSSGDLVELLTISGTSAFFFFNIIISSFISKIGKQKQ